MLIYLSGEHIARLLPGFIGCLPVVNGQGRLTGLITENDFVAHEKGIPFSTVHFPQLFGYWLKEGVESIYELARDMSVKEVGDSTTDCAFGR